MAPQDELIYIMKNLCEMAIGLLNQNYVHVF